MYKETNVRSDFGTGVADNCLYGLIPEAYVRLSRPRGARATQNAEHWRL